MSRWLRLIPVALLGLLLAALVWRLASPPDTKVRSALVGRMLPDVALGSLVPEGSPMPLRQPSEGPRLINLFASWCVPCIVEAPILGELERRGVRITGIAIRDRPDDVRDFLARHGNPYETIGADPESQVQLALGSAGVPESFIVDRKGVVRYQHIGPIMPQDVPIILAQLDKAR